MSLKRKHPLFGSGKQSRTDMATPAGGAAAPDAVPVAVRAGSGEIEGVVTEHKTLSPFAIRCILVANYFLVGAMFIWISFTMYSAWFIPSALAVKMFYVLLLVMPILTYGFTLRWIVELREHYKRTRWDWLPAWMQHKPETKIWTYPLSTALVTSAFLCYAAPVIPANLYGVSVTRTFDVTRHDGGFRQCPGFFIEVPGAIMRPSICRVSSKVRRAIPQTGRITFEGIETLTGFRVTKIVDYRAG